MLNDWDILPKRILIIIVFSLICDTFNLGLAIRRNHTGKSASPVPIISLLISILFVTYVSISWLAKIKIILFLIISHILFLFVIATFDA